MQKQKIAKELISPRCKSRSLHLSAPEVHASGFLMSRAFLSLVEVKHDFKIGRNSYHPAFRCLGALCCRTTSKALYNEVEKGKRRGVVQAVNRVSKILGEKIMKKQYLVCKKCGKKGMARYSRWNTAGYECKYCKIVNKIARYHLWGFATMNGEKFNYEEAKQYAESNSFIDREERYIVKWDDEKQGF